ncbi:hypothetical protein ACROYT_G038908 [Oculina patagonica]
MRTAMNYVLVNLAIADITVAIFMGIKFVLGPTFIHPDGIRGRYLCKFITGGTTGWTAAVASIYSLVAIAVEAYHAAFHPFKRRSRIMAKNLHRTIILIWGVALFWGLPLYLSVTYEDNIKTCAEQWPYPILPKIYSFGWIIVAGVVPIAVMSVLYFKVVRRLWFSKIAINNHSQMAFLRSKKRITTMVLFVSVIYVICWAPTLIIYFLASVLPSESMYSVPHKTTIVLATFNSSINPVVYSLRSQLFRQNLYKLFRCRGKKLSATKITPLQ